MSGENIMHIEVIENLLSEAGKNLDKLRTNNNNQETMKQAAIEELHEYQTETLHSLRILFEGESDGYDT